MTGQTNTRFCMLQVTSDSHTQMSYFKQYPLGQVFWNSPFFRAYVQLAENSCITKVYLSPHSWMHSSLRCLQGLHLLILIAALLVPEFNKTIPATRNDFGCFVWMPDCTNTDFIVCFYSAVEFCCLPVPDVQFSICISRYHIAVLKGLK